VRPSRSPARPGRHSSSRGRDAAGQVWHALWAQPILVFEAFVLAVAAAVLPKLTRRQIAPFGVALLLAMLLPDPAVPDTAIVVTVLATCLGLAVKAES